MPYLAGILTLMTMHVALSVMIYYQNKGVLEL